MDNVSVISIKWFYLSPIYRREIKSHRARNSEIKRAIAAVETIATDGVGGFPRKVSSLSRQNFFRELSCCNRPAVGNGRLSSVFPVQTQVRNLAMRPRWLQLATHCQADPRVYAIEGSIENFPRDSGPGRNEVAFRFIFQPAQRVSAALVRPFGPLFVGRATTPSSIAIVTSKRGKLTRMREK